MVAEILPADAWKRNFLDRGDAGASIASTTAWISCHDYEARFISSHNLKTKVLWGSRLNRFKLVRLISTQSARWTPEKILVTKQVQILDRSSFLCSVVCTLLLEMSMATVSFMILIRQLFITKFSTASQTSFVNTASVRPQGGSSSIESLPFLPIVISGASLRNSIFIASKFHQL